MVVSVSASQPGALAQPSDRPLPCILEASPGLVELLGHAYRCGAAATQARANGAVDGEHRAYLGVEMGRGLGEFSIGQIREFHSPGFGEANASTRDLVRIAERHAALDEPFSDVGGQRETLRGELGEALEVDGHRVDHAGDGGAQDVESVDLIEDGFLVFLQVAVVCQGQGLEDSEEGGQVADEAAGLATRELGDVGILLLGMIDEPVE